LNNIGHGGIQALSTALMNENNKVITLRLADSKFGNEGLRSLSVALMNENNKVTALDLSINEFGDEKVFDIYQRR